MKLTILGSGTCVPSLKRSSPSNYLEIGKNKILVDLGHGALIQSLKAGIAYEDIDIVFITHFHNDHVGELRALLQALDWTPGYTRKKTLTLVGPVGLKKFYNDLIIPNTGEPLPDTYKIEIKEIQDELKFADFTVEAAKTVHSDDSIAYRFNEKDKSVVISGDCDFDTGIIKLADKADVLLLECSYSNKSKVEFHLSSEECGTIAKKADVGKLILTHLYPPESTEETRLQETKKIFQNTILAKDLMEIEF